MKKQINKFLSDLVINKVLNNDLFGANLINLIYNQLFSLKSSVIKLIPISSIRTQENIIIETTQTLYGLNVYDNPLPQKVVNTAVIGFNEIKNCWVNCNSPIVVQSKNGYYQNYNLSTPFDMFNIVGGGVKAHGKKLAWWRKPINPLLIEIGILLNGSYITNWYHWQIEILSKVSLLSHLPSKYQNYPLLVSSSITNSKNHLELLKLAAPNKKIIALPDDTSHKVQSCIFIDSPVIAPPAFKEKGKVEQIGDHTIVKSLLIEYRNEVIKNSSKSTTKKYYPEKIFLLRKQTRRKYNQEEIYQSFNKLGFEGVYFDDLEVNEQVNIINNAKYIIGPVGAAWANIIYAKPGTQCLYWTASFIKEGIPFSNLAGNLDVDLMVVHFDVEPEIFFSNEKSHHVPTDLIMQAYLTHVKNNDSSN